METIVLLAHGSQGAGPFSHPKVKVITNAGVPLGEHEIRAFLRGAVAPEHDVSALGNFGGVSDAVCRLDLGVIPGPGPGFVDSGKRRGGAMAGHRIFVLRGMEASFAEVGAFAQGYRNVILLARLG